MNKETEALKDARGRTGKRELGPTHFKYLGTIREEECGMETERLDKLEEMQLCDRRMLAKLKGKVY